MTKVSYIAISPTDLDRLIRDASRLPELVKADQIATMCSISEDSIQKLVRRGVVKQYANEHLAGIWYKPIEIIKTFKPIT